MVATPKKNGSPGKGISPPKRRTTRSQTRDSAAPETPRKSPNKANGTPKATPSKMATPKSTPTKAATPKSSPAKTASPKASPAKAPLRAPPSARKPTSALATATPITAESSEEEEDSDLEEGQDVSDKGMQRLMDALGEEDLDEEDLAVLAAARGDEDEDEDEEDEDEDADEEMVEDDIPRIIPNKTGDTLAASIARSGLVAAEESSDEEEDEEEQEEDEEALSEIAYEDLPDTIQLTEEARASRVQRIKVNNKEALIRLAAEMRLDSSLPWIETMRVSYDQSVSEAVPDASNDLDRELAFYKQALHAAVEGRKLVLASGTPFSRPNDYFAEMVKTDEHMERVRQKLLDESAAIKASETAKKQRELKKFGKKVQVEKLEERLRKKKEMNEKVKGLKRKHGDLDDAADDFDVRLEEALADDKPKRKDKDAPKRKMPRNARDAKYGFGGKKRYAKENTAESTNDFGGKPKRGKGKPGAFRSKPKTGAAKRPGKSRRKG